MTAHAGISAAPRGMPSMRELGLWAGAALVVLAAHAGMAYAIHSFQPAEPPSEAAEPALMIDLTPLTVSTPEAVESQTVTEERPQEVVQPVETAERADNALQPETIEADTPEVAEPETVDPSPPETVERLTAEAPSETAKAQATEALASEEAPESVEPETTEIAEPTPVEPEVTAPEVVTALPPEVAVPVPRPTVREEPKERAQPRKAETKKAEPRRVAKKAETPSRKRARKNEVAKAQAAPAPKSKASVKSKASKAPTISPARWQSKVLAWLNRHKRYPAKAKSRREQGMVRITFSINASGSVLSARVSRSSGNPALDKAALDMVRRASPVPAPPPGIARSRMSLAVPVQFSLR